MPEVKDWSVVIELEKVVVKGLQHDLGEKIAKILRQHAIAGAGLGLIPVPGLDLAGVFGNIWTMYVRLNSAVGVSFSENIMKSIAIGIGTNLLSFIPGIAVAKACGFFAKFIPGIGTATGMVVDGATNYAIVMVMGLIYLNIVKYLLQYKRDLTEDELKNATKNILKDKESIRETYKKAKEEFAQVKNKNSNSCDNALSGDSLK